METNGQYKSKCRAATGGRILSLSTAAPPRPLRRIDLLQSVIDLFWFKYRIMTSDDLNSNNWNLMNIKRWKLVTSLGSLAMS